MFKSWTDPQSAVLTAIRREQERSVRRVNLIRLGGASGLLLLYVVLDLGLRYGALQVLRQRAPQVGLQLRHRALVQRRRDELRAMHQASREGGEQHPRADRTAVRRHARQGRVATGPGRQPQIGKPCRARCHVSSP